MSLNYSLTKTIFWHTGSRLFKLVQVTTNKYYFNVWNAKTKK